MGPISSCLITSFQNSGQAHLISMDLAWPHKITSKALQMRQNPARLDSEGWGSKVTVQDTINNCLVDCHSDVWSRFPVLSAVQRNSYSDSERKPLSITFVSEGNFVRVNSYFTRLVSSFQKTTSKPIGGKQSGLSIQCSSHAPLTVIEQISSSCFRFGSFVTEFLCLIPIQ